jgi:hypothetical protein
MSCFERKLASDVARKVSSRLANFDFRLPKKSEIGRQSEGIKDCISSGSNESRVLSGCRFEVDLSPVEFSRALTKDYIDGLGRIRSLADALEAARLNDSSCAWQVVTCYYVGFFSAVEILRACGDYISFFDKSTVDTIQQIATSNAGKLEPGSYQGIANYSSKSGVLTISYVKSSIRHHQYAWKKIALLAKSNCDGRNHEERQIVGRIVEALGQPSRVNSKFESPSDTRNHWNYEDPQLFGNVGKGMSKEFSKLMRNPETSLQWVRKNSNYSDLGSATCALGFASQFLRSITEYLGDKIVP